MPQLANLGNTLAGKKTNKTLIPSAAGINIIKSLTKGKMFAVKITLR